jgi:DNA mismatch repair protein MLH1
MLADYFSIEIDNDGNLLTLPSIHATTTKQTSSSTTSTTTSTSFVPDADRLPQFLLELAFVVDWEDEFRCLRDIGCAVARLWCLHATDQPSDDYQRQLEWYFQEFRRRTMMAPKNWALNNTIVHLADTESLFKIFERC